jgi:hypothetical protein
VQTEVHDEALLFAGKSDETGTGQGVNRSRVEHPARICNAG